MKYLETDNLIELTKEELIHINGGDQPVSEFAYDVGVFVGDAIQFAEEYIDEWVFMWWG